jgi:HPt (histidine-containing phosphotransfer) domain-containing protein
MSLGANFAQLAEDLPPEDLRHVIGVFQADVPRLVDSLSAAAAAGDAYRSQRVAHSLAGAAGVLGAIELEHACRALMTRKHLDPAVLGGSARAIAEAAAAALADVAVHAAVLDQPGRT